MIKKILLFILALIIVYLLYHYKSVIYGLSQAAGQAEVLYNAEEIDILLDDPNFPDSIKQQFQYIQEVKSFAQNGLGLNSSENYSTYYDQKGKAILWMLTASPRFKIKAYQWKFPIAGKFSYKGFFDSSKVAKEAEHMQKRNYDVNISEVSAWSTLGFFRDPILSSMLKRSKGTLAELIIHELSHATVYRKNEVQFNENFATFVGKEGAMRFLEQKFGSQSKELETYISQKKRQQFFHRFMHKATLTLDSLYHTFDSTMTEDEKNLKKTKQINVIKEKLAKSKYYENPVLGRKRLRNFTINNAYLSSYKTYHEKQDVFQKRLQKEFNDNLKALITAIKKE